MVAVAVAFAGSMVVSIGRVAIGSDSLEGAIRSGRSMFGTSVSVVLSV